MKIHFFRDHKKVLFNTFKNISLIVSLLAILLIIVNYFITNEVPDKILLLKIFVITFFLFPLLAIFIGFIKWKYEIHNQNKILNHYPFNELQKIGFKKVYKNRNSKREFIKEVFVKEIENYVIECDVDSQYEPNVISFKFINEKNSVILRFHKTNHELKSIEDLNSKLEKQAESLN